MNRKQILIFFLFFLILLHAATLIRYPAPFVDEGWFGSRAWAFLQTGHAFGELDRGVFDRYSGSWTYFPLIPVLLQAITQIGSDAPNLITLRVLSLLAGAGLLYALFRIGKQTGGEVVAWMSVILTGLSRVFFYSSHLARYDIFVAALGFAAIALIFQTGATGLRRHFLAGFLLGIAFEVHPNGVLYIPAALALYFQEFRWSVFQNRRFWSFAGGGLIGLFLYAVLHILRYPETWFAINRMVASMSHLPPLLSWNPSVIFHSLTGTLKLAAYASPFLFPLQLISVFYLWKTGRSRLLVFILVLFLTFALLVQHKLLYYAILFIPVLELALACFLADLFSAVWSKRTIAVAGKVLAAVLILVSVIYSSIPLTKNWSGDFHRASQSLQSVIRPQEVVMGNQVWWLSLYKNRWYSWEGVHYLRQYKPRTTVTDSLLELRPDIFLLDGHVSAFMMENPPQGSYSAQYQIPPAEFKKLLQERGSVRAKIDGGTYGEIYVIEFRWDR